MKPYYVVLLMGAAAMGGGLVVRYSDHPVEITMAHVAPAVLAPPVAPSTPARPRLSAAVQPADAAPVPKQTEPPEKPSAFTEPVRLSRPEVESRIVARVKIPPEPPAITPLEHSVVTPPAPPAAAVAPKNEAAASKPAVPPVSAPAPAAPETNHATLKAGMLISVRINEALSSNLNSTGDVFSGTLDRPLIADGFIIAERGARVRGEVVDSKSERGASELTIRLREVLASDGQRVHLVSSPWHKSGSDAIASRNVYDVALTRGGAAVVRPHTSVTFRLDEPVELTEKK